MTARAAIILAAGQGTRMRSSLPKVLHRVGGRAMVDWSIELAKAVGCSQIVVVASPHVEAVPAHVLATSPECRIAYQDPPQGTGHAVKCAHEALADFAGDIVVLYGDTPLIQPSSIEALFAQLKSGAAVGVLGFDAADPGAYGRLVTDAQGRLTAIVEARDATPEQRQITLCNSGVMAASSDSLFSLLSRVTNDNAKQEYYLTDIVALARQDGQSCAVERCPEADVLGVNSRLELAEAEAAFQNRRRTALMADGVTMIAPETVFLSHDTEIAPDVTVEPHTVFGLDVEVASGTTIKAFSHLEGARVGTGCDIGPYARLRPGSVIGDGAKIGNFVEVKNTRVGDGAKASHLSYLGDGEIGSDANIGAGTIFCNYDGFLKYKTTIGAGAFIGSNSALVAPVTIGEGAYVGSGSVVTKDVEPNALAVGRGRQIQKAGWANAFRERMRAIKAARKAK